MIRKGMTIREIKVLLVDDNAYMRQIVKTVLRGVGCNVIKEAANGMEAFDVLANGDVEIIICDVEMAEMNGLEFVQKLRAGKPVKEGLRPPAADTPVILLTSHSKREIVEQAQKAGVNGFLVKPVTPKILLSRMAGILQLAVD